MLKRMTILVAALVVTLNVQAEEKFEAAVAAVRSMVPDIQIDSVRPAPFPGFVEMLLGAQLIYVSDDGKYLIDGQLIDIATRKNSVRDEQGCGP